MKNFTKILPAFCVLLVVFLFAGCNVKVPVLTVQGCHVSWNWVANASKYEVDVNGTSYYTTDNYYNLAPLIHENRTTKEVKVRAITKNQFLGNSDFSDIISVTVGDQVLPAPQNFKIQISSNSYICEWNSVTNADYYCIKLMNLATNTVSYYATNGRSYNLYGVVEESGNYQAYVFAYSNSQTHIYAPSDASNTVSFAMDVPLSTPESVSLRMESGNLMCYWPTVDGADSYNVSILNGQTFNVRNDTTKDTQSLNLTSKGITLGSGDAVFACVGALGAENSGYIESPYTDICSIFGNGSKVNFADVKYDFVGSEFDFVADSYAELQDIVWYTLLYRINSVKCFINYSVINSSVVNEFSRAITAYNEIKRITYSVAPNADGSYVLTITYRHTSYPTKTSPVSSEQSTSVQPTSYTTTPRDSSFDDFAIDARAKTAMVYNSEQLYFVIQEGYKPIFPGTQGTNALSTAEIAYNEAKNVLRQIVSDDMSDLQKTTAIYDWLCYTVHYDHELLTIDAKIKQGLMSGVSSDYRGFYIEGVLFDEGQAVCDGISKTFALLCGIENITCYKVIGVSNTELNPTNEVDHAWNKVLLDLVGNDGVGEWYALDATQNDMVDYNSPMKTEYLTHRSFLHTDEWMKTVLLHKEIYPCRNDAVTSEFNYYQNATYNNINDLFIESSIELNALAMYAKANLKSVEFLVNKTSFLDYNYDNICDAFRKGTITTMILSKEICYEDGLPYVLFVVFYGN